MILITTMETFEVDKTRNELKITCLVGLFFNKKMTSLIFCENWFFYLVSVHNFEIENRIEKEKHLITL